MATISTYQEVQQLCTDVLCKHYGVTESTISNLSCYQISQANELFAGNLIGQPVSEEELKSPDVSIERVDIPRPQKNEKEVCKPREYVDLLYVPSMPKSGKQAWFLLTQEGALKVKEEISYMDALQEKMVGIYSSIKVEGESGGPSNGTTENHSASTKQKKDDVLKEMGKYGILSKFLHKPHEFFLKDELQLQRYRALMLFKQVVVAKPEKVSGLLISEKSVDGIASEFQQEYKNAIENSKFWHTCIGILTLTTDLWRLPKFIERTFSESYTEIELKQFREDAIDDLLEELNTEIKKLEKIAEKAAAQKNTDDGTPHVYFKKKGSEGTNGYFTSEHEEVVYSNLTVVDKTRGLYKLRRKNILGSDLDDLAESLKKWQEKADFIANIENFNHWKFNSSDLSSITERLNHAPLYMLNSRGIVLIEQCLSDSDLVGCSYTGVDYDDDLLTDKEVATLLSNAGASPRELYDESQHKVSWSYFPAVAMLARVNQTLADKTKTTKNLLQVTGLPGLMFQPLLTLKRIVEDRIKVLQEKARTNAKENKTVRLYFKGKKAYQLIVDEKKWEPKNKTKELFAKTGKSEYQIVECYLASNEGRMSFVRGPSWMVPDGVVHKIDHCGHLYELSQQLSRAEPLNSVGNIEGDPSSLLNVMKGLKDEFAKNGSTNIGTINFGKVDLSKMDVALSKGVYKWKKGATEVGPAYSGAAQYQFMRFSSAATIGAKADLLEAEKTGKVTIGEYGAKLELNILQGSYTLNAQLPCRLGKAFLIPYIVKVPKPLKIKQAALVAAGKDEVARLFNAGNLRMDLSTTLYGMLGASIALGAKTEFGMLDEGGIGVRGTSSTMEGFNDWQPETPYIEGVGEKLEGKAADLSASVNAFAGVEIGGKLNAELKWEPPQLPTTHKPLIQADGNEKVTNKDGFLTLAKFSAEAAVAFGAAGSAIIKFSLSGGRLIVLFAAKLAMGPGVGGKFAFEIHHSVVNEFFDLILKIMNQEGFRRISIFDESKVEGTDKTNYEFFNTLLTAQLMTGLHMADLLLLPFEALGKYTEASSRRELAPSMAQFILSRDGKEAEHVKKWVTNLPPETIALLFEMLAERQIYNAFEILGDVLSEGADNEDEYNENNQNQAKSIIKVMELIASNKYIPYEDTKVSNLPARVFSKAVTRMGFKYYEVPTKKEEQWLAFLNNWLSLYRFTQKYLSANEFEVFVASSRKLCIGYEVALLRHKQSSQVKVKCCYIGDCQSKEEMDDRRELAGYNDKEFQIFKTGSVCDIFN
ncbi:hypothetical protein ACMXYX_04660 [Neptuniibacter sp. QD72_48]|uniref:hypothetical protein n=1 Tax=Neptuniibacter sp. QD72_48 TaxID=3398214 RepID=UPI0039F4A923